MEISNEVPNNVHNILASLDQRHQTRHIPTFRQRKHNRWSWDLILELVMPIYFASGHPSYHLQQIVT